MYQQCQKYQRHASPVQTTSPPDKALPRPLGSFSNKGHTTYQHVVTMRLLETIKEACRDRSKTHDTRTDNSPGPCEGTSRVTHTHSTHTLRLGRSSLSHPLVTPTTDTSVQDNTELTSPTGRRAFFGLKQYKSSVFFLHTIRVPDAQTHVTCWC
jgi:hypothetical protein